MKVVITIEIPDAAASVSLNTTDQEDDDRSLVEIYWSDYLSNNGRELGDDRAGPRARLHAEHDR